MYPVITTTDRLDALPDQAVIVNVSRDESPVELYDAFQKSLPDMWGSYGFASMQTTQELATRYPSGFYVVFDPNGQVTQHCGPRTGDHVDAP